MVEKRKTNSQSVQNLAQRAITKAYRDLVKERAATNDYVIVWQNDRVVKVPARKLAG